MKMHLPLLMEEILAKFVHLLQFHALGHKHLQLVVSVLIEVLDELVVLLSGEGAAEQVHQVGRVGAVQAVAVEDYVHQRELGYGFCL